MNKFFKTDLDLNQYWIHKLIKYTFILLFFLYVITIISENVNKNPMFILGYSQTDTLENRLTHKVKLLGDLIHKDEFVSDNEQTIKIWENHYKNILKSEYYCSSNIWDKLNKVSDRTHIFLYKGNEDLVSLNEFEEYLKEEKALCVEALTIKGYFNNQKILMWGLFADDLKMWKFSYLKTIWVWIKLLSFAIMIFMIPVLIYRWLVIPLIFYVKKQ